VLIEHILNIKNMENTISKLKIKNNIKKRVLYSKEITKKHQ